MIQLANQYQNSTSSAMGKAATLSGPTDSLINLSIGDPDQITHDLVIDSAMLDAKDGHTKYTHALGDPELRKAIQDHFKKGYDLSIPINEMLMVVGACHGMYLALKALLNPGDEVLVPEPYFTPYLQQITHNQGIAVPVITKESESFHLTIEALEAAVTENSKVLILNNPNNPTGASLSKEELRLIVAFAHKNNLIILSDEVYRGFSFDKEFTPLYQIEGARERTLVLGSFSKDYAMTGWRIGYVFGPGHVIDCMRELNEGICFTAPSISQRGALHALMHHDEILSTLREEYQARINYVYERIQTLPGMTLHKPEATFYLFASIKETGLSSEAFCEKALKEAQVLFLPGTAFGASGEGYVRIACTVEIPKLKEAFDRLETLSY